MKMDVAGQDARALSQLTRQATRQLSEVLKREPRLSVRPFTFDGPPLTPEQDGYRALDFVQIGMNEKTERRLAFLLIVTEVEIAAASLSYLLALPSQLTNVAVVSTRRLADYGSEDLNDHALMADRLATLLLHCFGRLLNLSYVDDPANYLYSLRVPDDLDAMGHFTDRQFDRMAAALSQEANDRFSEGSKWSFVLRHALGNLPRIVRGALRANPLRIASKLPTMIATALSVIILLIFGGETWDFAASVSGGELAIFTVFCFVAATFVLYRAFSFKLVATRHGNTSESAVVTAGATYLALVLTLGWLFLLFALLMYGVVVFVFPDPLMSSWTSVEDGGTLGAHLRLVIFLAAVGVFSGSLGGSADSRSVVRNVLFAVDGV
jgi:predicted Zn-dependent protease